MLSIGKHPCLFCDATKEQLKNPDGKIFSQRTLETLDQDLKDFQDNGGNLKEAKAYNNVIEERLFNVPLDQVSFDLLLLKKNFVI